MFAQDTILLSKERLNHSITDNFSIYESKMPITLENFLTDKEKLPVKLLTNSVANLDFTTSTFFIDFVLISKSDQHLILQTAREITNGVVLYNITDSTNVRSGDAIPFDQKTIYSNKSLLPIHIKANTPTRFVLKLTSDGEIISLPMTFWEQKAFQKVEKSGQFKMGVFYGIFIFVIIIYLTFYVQLKDPLFLFYTIYVFFSGSLQFALDGYIHQYVFKSGGYLTQHAILFIAGSAVFFLLHYAMRYLEAKGRMRITILVFITLVASATVLSLIPGIVYEISYPLINGFSLISTIYLFAIGVKTRRVNPSKINSLFLVGLFGLILGAAIFILGNFSIINAPEITQRSLKAGALVEIICLSILMAGKYRALQKEKEEAQQQLLIELEEKNKITEEANIRLEQEVADRTKEIEQQRLLLKEKNDDFVASIKYAERIQKALLSNEDKFKSILPESCIVFKPRDIVSGDFFWIEEIPPVENWPQGLTVYATADCTGHGVPGAFVSIVCNNLLKMGGEHQDVQYPGQALDFVNREINTVLNSQYSNQQIMDGMDVALCAIDKSNNMLYFAGAKNGVYILRNNEILELKADKRGIGYTDHQEDESFTTHQFQLEKNDRLFTFSDGFIDQFGGPKGKKFSSRRLKDLIIQTGNKEIQQQGILLEKALSEWMQNEEQVDDILLIGVQI